MSCDVFTNTILSIFMIKFYKKSGVNRALIFLIYNKYIGITPIIVHLEFHEYAHHFMNRLKTTLNLKCFIFIQRNSPPLLSPL